MKDLTAKDLIGKGYFPKEIPKGFSTNSLAEKFSNLDFSTFTKKERGKWYKTSNISIPKFAHSRRILNVPAPFPQMRLSQLLVKNTEELNEYYSQSKLSLTRPIVKEESDRAVERKYHFSKIIERRIESINDKKYILKTDISRYFPTIYTHSIPWALHTKEVAKQTRGDSLLGNTIDEYVRNIQDGQTMGLPVGPDTSLIISEVIGTAIDIKLQEAHPNIIGSRYTDDFEFYFKTQSEAEKVLNTIQEIVRHFELDINPVKTEIISSPNLLEPIWLSNLKLYQFRSSATAQKNDIKTFFSTAFYYQNQSPYEGVLKYCLKKIKNLKIKEDNWSLFEALILHIMLIDPTTLPLIENILFGYKEIGYPINEQKIKDTIAEIFASNIAVGNNYEIMWALSLSNKLQLKISNESSKLLFNLEDSFSNILTMEAYTNGYIEGGYEPEYFKTLLNENELYGRNWLFAYEMSVKGWLKPHQQKEYVKKDTFYNQLFESKVEFYHNDRKAEIKNDDWLTALLNDDDIEELFIQNASSKKPYLRGGSGGADY